jgi:hypothetical protein
VGRASTVMWRAPRMRDRATSGGGLAPGPLARPTPGPRPELELSRRAHLELSRYLAGNDRQGKGLAWPGRVSIQCRRLSGRATRFQSRTQLRPVTTKPA